MKEETQDERMKRIMADLNRCIERESKVWTKEACEEWYKTFRCE